MTNIIVMNNKRKVIIVVKCKEIHTQEKVINQNQLLTG